MNKKLLGIFLASAVLLGSQLVKASNLVVNPSVITSSTVSANLPNPLVVGGTASSTIRGDGTSSDIPVINTQVYLPKPTALAAGVAVCGTTTGVSDLGTCYNDILAAATASGTKVIAQGFDYSVASWTVAFAQNTNGKFLDMSCVKNATKFTWTGNGTSTFINAGSGASLSGYIGHPVPYGFDGCTFINAAGPNSTNTFAVLGGANGAEGFRATNNRFQGWGGSGVFVFGSNTYSTDISNNQFSDNAGSILVPGGLTNSTERLNFTGNQFGDNFSGITNNPEANCIQFTNVSNSNLTDNQYDDCQVVVHSGVWKLSIKGGQAEDPALAAGTHLGYPFIEIDNSTSTSVSISDMAMVHDGTTVTSTASEFISCGGSLTVTGVTAVLNGSASTSPRFVTAAGSDCQWTGTGIVNLGGTAFTRLDGLAPTSTAQMQAPYANFAGTSTPTFTVSSGTVTGTFNQFLNLQNGRINLNGSVASETLFFAKAWVSIPTCSIQDASTTATNSLVRSMLITTSSVLFQDATPFPTSSAYDFQCFGNPN